MGTVQQLPVAGTLADPAVFKHHFEAMAKELAQEAQETDQGAYNSGEPGEWLFPDGLDRNLYLGVVVACNFINNLMQFGYGEELIQHAVQRMLCVAAKRHQRTKEKHGK